MALWNAVCKTDPADTKPGEMNGQKITTISPASVYRAATEQFGPVGMGWGYKILEERFDKGAPVFSASGDPAGNEVMHTLYVEVWAVINGEKCATTHFGHTPYIQKTKYGLKTDFDAAKKSLTDAVKKALSMFGFNADIYLRQFDDVNYVAKVQAEYMADKVEADSAKKAQAFEDFATWMDERIAIYSELPSAVTLRNRHRETMEVINARARKHQLSDKQEAAAKQRLNEAYESRLAHFLPPKKLACTECGIQFEGQLNAPCPECGGKSILGE